MTAIKRRLYSLEDEPFDSFKRRRIEHAKIHTSSASLQLPEDHKQEPKDLYSIPILHKQDSRAIHSASRAKWGSKLKATFASQHACEPESKTDSFPHRQLNLTSSKGIGSPVHQSIDANLEERKMLTTNRGYNKFKNLPGKKLRTSFSEHNSKSSRKAHRKLHDLQQRRFLNELLQAPEKLPLHSSQTDSKHVQGSTSTKHQELEHWSRKKCKNMVPLSTLLISTKEYYNLTVLPPVAFDREERYNWGHIKRNEIVRNNIIRHQIRVLQMSSQAPIPSAQVEKHSTETLKRLERQTQPDILCKVKWNSHSRPSQRIVRLDRNGQIAPRVEKSKQRRVALNSQNQRSFPRVSEYFEFPHKDRNSLENKRIHDESETHTPSRPRIEGHTPNVTQGLSQHDEGIPKNDGSSLHWQDTLSPMILNVSSSPPHVEYEESTEPINPYIDSKSMGGNEESREESVSRTRFEITKHPCDCKAQFLQHERSLSIGFNRNGSSKKTNPAAHLEETSVQDQPASMADEGYHLTTQHEAIPIKDEKNVIDSIVSDKTTRISYPQDQVAVSSKNSVTSEPPNILSELQKLPSPTLNLGKDIKNTDNMDLFSESPLPYQILKGKESRHPSRSFPPIMSAIGVSQSSPLNENDFLVPDTPSPSNRSKNSSFEAFKQKAPDHKAAFHMVLETGGENREVLFKQSGKTDSINYSEGCEGSTHDLARLRQAQLLAISDNASSDDTSIYETSESRGEESQMCEENSDFAPNPSQTRKKVDQEGINRLEKEMNQKKKIIPQNFVIRDSYHRKGFDFVPSYFSTRSLFPFH